MRYPHLLLAITLTGYSLITFAASPDLTQRQQSLQNDFNRAIEQNYHSLHQGQPVLTQPTTPNTGTPAVKTAPIENAPAAIPKQLPPKKKSIYY